MDSTLKHPALSGPCPAGGPRKCTFTVYLSSPRVVVSGQMGSWGCEARGDSSSRSGSWLPLPPEPVAAPAVSSAWDSEHSPAS